MNSGVVKWAVDLIARLPIRYWFIAIAALVVAMTFFGFPWLVNALLFAVTALIALGLFFYFGIRSIG